MLQNWAPDGRIKSNDVSSASASQSSAKMNALEERLAGLQQEFGKLQTEHAETQRGLGTFLLFFTGFWIYPDFARFWTTNLN